MPTTAYPRLRAALPVGPVRRPLDDRPDDTGPDAPVGDPEELTRDLLTRAAESIGPQARVTGFRRWWDGDAWVPLLTVRIAGRPAWVVETGGEVQVLPARQGLARRLLRRGRPKPAGGALAPPRTRLYGSIAVGTPTRPGVEVLRGALSPRQLRERAAARRRLAQGTRTSTPDGQLGLFGESDVDGGPVAAPRRTPPAVGPVGPVVRLAQGGDVLQCRRSGCGALVPLPPPGSEPEELPVCPLCARP